ncbi:hypothetical protein FHP25_37480 [Vineibacter terrae]|uniref:Uncharacterized protein n=1 Tax=Vineibacter terrae TaxID=2586908 RepID=A0A5C8P8S0_9HYPH|nr:hypothetical protein [Vineibacter terrae]TXL69773.1 hypothetical protein FHP25_37480 [Vineibacter terrae]
MRDMVGDAEIEGRVAHARLPGLPGWLIRPWQLIVDNRKPPPRQKYRKLFSNDLSVTWRPRAVFPEVSESSDARDRTSLQEIEVVMPAVLHGVPGDTHPACDDFTLYSYKEQYFLRPAAADDRMIACARG